MIRSKYIILAADVWSKRNNPMRLHIRALVGVIAAAVVISASSAEVYRHPLAL